MARRGGRRDHGKLYLVGEEVTTRPTISGPTPGCQLAVRPFLGDHQAAEVINGKFYLFSRLDGNSRKVQSTPSYQHLVTVGLPPWAGGSVSTALIGKVYAAGESSVRLPQAAVFNPTTNPGAIASMLQGLNHSAAGWIQVLHLRRPDGEMSSNGNTVESATATNTWTSVWTPARYSAAATGSWQDGQAVFYGGEFYVMGGETLTGTGAPRTASTPRGHLRRRRPGGWGVPMLAAWHFRPRDHNAGWNEIYRRRRHAFRQLESVVLGPSSDPTRRPAPALPAAPRADAQAYQHESILPGTIIPQMRQALS